MNSLALTAEKDFAGHEAVGKRSNQEDAHAFSVIPAGAGAGEGLLLVVADGMGGHAAGQRASQMAVSQFARGFHRGGETMAERFVCALDTANAALGEAIDADPDHLEGMGTTILAIVVTPLGLEWLSVGDSPLYLFRQGKLRRVNADHSFRPLLNELVAKGDLTAQQAAASSLKNRLRAALVGGEVALVDQSPAPLPLVEDDIIIAGSDGLQTLTDDQIAELLQHYGKAAALPLALRLVQTVLDAGAPKQDNITAAIIKPGGDWLRAPFAFAPAETVTPVDPNAATQRIVRRTPSGPRSKGDVPPGMA